MQIKHLYGLLLAGALVFGHSAAAQGEAEFELRIEGRIEIGPDGRVIEYNIDEDEVSAPVESLVAAAVRRWRFEPIVEDGRAVIGVTDMCLLAVADDASIDAAATDSLDSSFRLRTDVVGTML